MDALLLALLIGLLLDQGDRSQRLAREVGPDGAALVILIVMAGAAVSAGLGMLMARLLPGAAGILFFSFTLIAGGIDLLATGRKAPHAKEARATETHAMGKHASTKRMQLYAALLANRLTGRTAFLLVGVAAMTGNGWATAIGGVLGGLAGVLPPLFAGRAYEAAFPLARIMPLPGGTLVIGGLACALWSLGLL